MTGNGKSRGRLRGRVVWFNDRLGYGFIRPEASLDGQEEIALPENRHLGDVFVHYSAIAGDGHRTLARGQWVEYSVIAEQMKRQTREMAHHVLVIRRPEPTTVSHQQPAKGGA